MIDTGLIENREELLKRLLCYGLFPERIPPIFSSVKFGLYYYDKILKGNFNYNKKLTYKHIVYPLTQDKKVRMLGIPNCIAYVQLCYLFYEHWEKLKQLLENCWTNYYNPNMIRMQKQKKRLFVLNSYFSFWGTEEKRLVSTSKPTFNEIDYKLRLITGNKYGIHLDISKFYSSIYAHAISWALISKKTSKELYRDDKKKKTYIKNVFDYECFESHVMSMQDKESFGIPIGPDTSYILADILLSQIDKALFSRGFRFIRYIDDYYFCATNENDLQNFVNELRKQLYIYKLNLNDEKTEINKFPVPLKTEWTNCLDNYVLPDTKDKKFFDKLLYFIDKAVSFSEKYGARTIKYALRYVVNHYTAIDLTPHIKKLYLYVLHLTYIYPYLIDCSDDLLDRCYEKSMESIISNNLNNIIKEAIKQNNYDTISWVIYICDKYGLAIDVNLLIKKNFVVKDCLCLTLLLYYLKNKGIIKEYQKTYYKFYYKELKLKSDDEFWLLEYELFKEDIISNLNKLPKSADKKIQAKYDEKQKNYTEMKKAGISFVTI